MIFNLFVLYLLIIVFLSFKGYCLNRLYYFNCILIICIVGLRGYDIGSVDTVNYVRFFLGKQMDYHDSGKEIEIGLSLFNGIFKPFVKTGWLYLLIVAIISLTPLFYIVKKISPNKHLSILLLFIVLGNIISLYFVCMRQVLGMSFLLCGIIIWLKKIRFYKVYYIVFLFIGWLFHTVIILPGILFMLFSYYNISRVFYAGIAIVSFCLGVLGVFDDFSMFLFLFSYSGGLLDLLSNYAMIEFTGNIGYLYSTFRTILCLMICLFLNKDDFSNVFTKMFLIGVTLSNAFPGFQEMYRLSGLFCVFGIITISQLASSIFGKKHYFITSNIIKLNLSAKIIFMTILMYSYFNYSSANIRLQKRMETSSATLIPYSFFWEDKYNY